MTKDYGMNSLKAFKDGECDKSTDGKHRWGNERNLGRCHNSYTCLLCGAKMSIDSSD